MPATITHHTFANDVLKKIDKKYKNQVDNDLFYIFSQGTDPFMFYNIESLRRGKAKRKLHDITHSKKTKKFFITITNYIKDEKLEDNKQVMSFLYGLICHYVLDSNVHPYVSYKTGVFDKRKKETYKYNGNHSLMEIYLDKYILEKKHNKKDDKITKNDLNIHLKEFNKELNNIMDYSFKKVYHEENASKMFYKSIKQMKRFIIRYRIDNTGIKKVLYKMVNLVVPKKVFRFETLSYNYKPKDEEYYLNNNHEIWYYHANPTISKNLSFDELYEESIKEAIDIIKQVNLYINDEIKDLDNVFTNKSYLTGLDCKEKTIFKKFYF